MPSRRSQLFLNTLQKNRPLFDAIGDRVMRVGIDNATLAALPMLGTQGKKFMIDDVPALMITPAESYPQDALIIHCHGGAYVAGGLVQARAVASKICAAANIQTLTFAYRLAPEHPYPAQLEDAMKVYRYVKEKGYDMSRVILSGESAGGNLCLILILKLINDCLPLPAALALLSPWTDLAQTGDSYQALEKYDATLNRENVLESAKQYAAGVPLDDPMLSPIYADFHGFPPVQIHVGTREILLSDSETLLKCLKRDDVQATLIRFEGMCHVFQVFGFMESRLSLKAIGLFIRRVLNLDANLTQSSL